MIDLNKYAKEFLARGESLEFGTPVNDDVIKMVADQLNLKIHGQYASFLKNIGGVAVFNSWINGIPADDPLSNSAANVYGDTSRLRESGLPKNYIVIKTSEDEFAWCLDGALQVESPVYGVNLPFRGSVKKIADNFDAYVKETLEEAIKLIDG